MDQKVKERKESNQLKLLSLEMIIVMITFIVALSAVWFIIRNVLFLDKGSFDMDVFDFLAEYVTGTNTAIMNFFTFFGSQKFLVPAFLILIFYYYFFKKDRWFGTRISAVATSSLIVMFTLKWLFNRPRPITPLLNPASGLSFPSGHAFMSFTFCCIVTYIIYKENTKNWLRILLLILMLLFTFLVGVSRVYLRVHYASDVIAGFSMGFMWVVISLSIMHFLEKKHKSRLPDVEATDLKK